MEDFKSAASAIPPPRHVVRNANVSRLSVFLKHHCFDQLSFRAAVNHRAFKPYPIIPTPHLAAEFHQITRLLTFDVWHRDCSCRVMRSIGTTATGTKTKDGSRSRSICEWTAKLRFHGAEPAFSTKPLLQASNFRTAF